MDVITNPLVGIAVKPPSQFQSGVSILTLKRYGFETLWDIIEFIQLLAHGGLEPFY